MVLIVTVMSAIVAATYPANAGPTGSPSSRYSVESLDFDTATASGNNHALYLIDHVRETRALLMEYGRSADVAWAPDREAVAVTDRVGSTDSDIVVFEIDEGVVARKVALFSTLTAALPDLRAELSNYGHRYLELVRWKTAGRLDCRLRAHDGKPAIDRRYVVGLDGTAVQLKLPR